MSSEDGLWFAVLLFVGAKVEEGWASVFFFFSGLGDSWSFFLSIFLGAKVGE